MRAHQSQQSHMAGRSPFPTGKPVGFSEFIPLATEWMVMLSPLNDLVTLVEKGPLMMRPPLQSIAIDYSHKKPQSDGKIMAFGAISGGP